MYPKSGSQLRADSRIEFKLACLDPEGNKTNGITRTKTKETIFDIDDDPNTPEKIKFTAEGGKDAWDTTRYLNIWTCNLGNSLLGYAQFPRWPSKIRWSCYQPLGIWRKRISHVSPQSIWDCF